MSNGHKHDWEVVDHWGVSPLYEHLKIAHRAPLVPNWQVYEADTLHNRHNLLHRRHENMDLNTHFHTDDFATPIDLAEHIMKDHGIQKVGWTETPVTDISWGDLARYHLDALHKDDTITHENLSVPGDFERPEPFVEITVVFYGGETGTFRIPSQNPKAHWRVKNDSGAPLLIIRMERFRTEIPFSSILYYNVDTSQASAL